MTYQFEEKKEAIINEVLSRIKDKLKSKQAQNCIKFAREFLISIAEDDMMEHDVEDLYGCVMNFWQFMLQRAPNEHKVSVYNPDFERHGWQSTHTIVQIIHQDMPFLVDSIRMELDRLGLTTYLNIHIGGIRIVRDKQHTITDVFSHHDNAKKQGVAEAPILFQVNRVTDEEKLKEILENVERILEDVRVAVEDWQMMQDKISQSIDELKHVEKYLDPEEYRESIDFIKWIVDGNLTLLGIRDYDLVKENEDYLLRVIPHTGLGVLRESSTNRISRELKSMTPEARKLVLSSQILIIAKTGTRSTVHRPVYTDYIGIKRFNKKGEVIGERRIVGTYTSSVYNREAKSIPFIRRKVKYVLDNTILGKDTHAWKNFQHIIETLPRDDLFQASPDDLLKISVGIYHLQERRRIRSFIYKDVYGRFISCLVYVPRDRFNTELRFEMQQALAKYFNAEEITFFTRFSESVLARIHFVIRLDPKQPIGYDEAEVEKMLIAIGRKWEDDFSETLIDTFGEEEGSRLIDNYGHAFPGSYKEKFNARTAVYDIRHIEKLDKKNNLELNFYKPVDNPVDLLRFKIYRLKQTIPLSDVIPILENMGMRILSEQPYELRMGDGSTVWINDFGMKYTQRSMLNVDKIRHLFQDAFEHTWFELAENDSFNQLVIAAELEWRYVAVLRAYAKYFRQIGFTFSQEYIESTLNNNPLIAKDLANLFKTKFDPQENPNRQQEMQALQEKLLKAMDEVANLDEDRILRRYLVIIEATLRTNFFQDTVDHGGYSYLSFKLNPGLVPDMPLPKPMFEIFVYSPRFEGVHLRSGKVARGGLRWSDRREDFRTEILGLMKAQAVKNAVIVPDGAKGGFVPKHLPENGSRDDIQQEAIACYKNFIRGLLDITDNYHGTDVVKPKAVVCYDEDDPYLVVAADKGTATFSDIANEISQQSGFWLGDAFASGGSAGYDHKKMGITARGAWESVKRHFRELGQDIQSQPFTAIGIGDMAGDVFGNGMLLSRQTKLVGAFNHLHIFLDPNPDVEISFKERERLFNLPRSGWNDYNQELISPGGGIFDRKAKSIKLTQEIKELLGLQQDYIVPNELIQAMLRAPIDLLWNGGIGTFVKADSESHLDVGDRTNDAIRINASELGVKVVGEGGNLGLTQLARIQYSVQGGKMYTDFIDNSAGVDCSDHEVNIKILLNSIIESGDLTQKQRNELLATMTDEVAELVLEDNYQQTQAISLMSSLANKHVHLHIRYMQDLESSGLLNRELEFLPDEKILKERKLAGRGMTQPGISILLAYSKAILNKAILDSDVPEDSYLSNVLEWQFPKPLVERYRQQMETHRLRREIIATQLANHLVNQVGFTFTFRLQEETGAPVSAIVKAYTVARVIFDIDNYWQSIQSLDNKVPCEVQNKMLLEIIRLLRRISRWVLRNRRMNLDIAEAIEYYSPGVQQICTNLPSLLTPAGQKDIEKQMKEYNELGVPVHTAQFMASIRYYFPTLNLVEAANELGVGIDRVAKIYYGVGDVLEINWLRQKVVAYPVDNHWEALSREALRDDLDWQQRQLTIGVAKCGSANQDPHQLIDEWKQKYKRLVDRWHSIQMELRSTNTLNFTMYYVAIRELLDLTQTTVQTAGMSLPASSDKSGQDTPSEVIKT